jgi:hypothetical protein
MSNNFDTSIKLPSKEEKKSGFETKKVHIPGKIVGTIGQGDDAKNSLIYLTLKWAFRTGIIISILIVVNHWLFRINEKTPDFMGDIKIAWEIIVPLITLALGYAFGKSQK